jgi:hypothetical protein
MSSARPAWEGLALDEAISTFVAIVTGEFGRAELARL